MKNSQKKVDRELAAIKKVFSQNERFESLVEEKMSSLWTRFKQLVVLFFTMLGDYVDAKSRQSDERQKTKAIKGLNNLIDYAEVAMIQMQEKLDILGDVVKTSGLYAYVPTFSCTEFWSAQKEGCGESNLTMQVSPGELHFRGVQGSKDTLAEKIGKDDVKRFVENLFSGFQKKGYETPGNKLFNLLVKYADNSVIERKFERAYAEKLARIRKDLKKSLKKKLNQASSLQSELA